MKTIHEYEPEDIDLKTSPVDPVHAFLLGQILLVKLSPLKEEGQDAMFPIQRMIADMLNSASKQGISITKSEVPAVFRNAA